MTRSEARAGLIAKLNAANPDGEHRDGLRWAAFQRWCDLHGQPSTPRAQPLPGDATAERVLMRYLAAHHGSWSWSTARHAAISIAKVHLRAGHPDPRGDDVRVYLSVVRRDMGTRKGRPSDALTLQQVMAAAIVGRWDPASPTFVRLRGVIAVGEALQLDVTRCSVAQALPTAAFRVGETDIRITPSVGDSQLIDRHRQPILYNALAAALSAGKGTAHPLGRQPDLTNGGPTDQDRQDLRAAWGRAFPAARRPGRGRPLADEVSGQHAVSSAQERLEWMAQVDAGLKGRIRDVAYFLVGIATAHRHIELGRLQIGAIRPTKTGYRWQLAKHKGALVSAARGGTRTKPLPRNVDHLEDDSKDCPPHCPACALQAHLSIRLKAGDGPDAPVFANRDGRPLTSDAGVRIVQRLASGLTPAPGVDDGTQRVLGSRSLRVTAVTLARQAGMSRAEIADQLTNHSNGNLVDLYVREVDLWGGEPVVLSLTAPSATSSPNNNAGAPVTAQRAS